MQQNPSCPDMGSPYMLWQYVQLMAPLKHSNCNIHPAFTHMSPQTIDSMSYLQDQCLNNLNYHTHHPHYQQLQHNQHQLDNPLLYNGYQAPRHADYMPPNENLNSCKSTKTHPAKVSHKMKLCHLAKPLETPSVPTCTSPKKKPSFTIEEILRKGSDRKPQIKTFPLPPPETDLKKQLTDTIISPVTSTASTPQKTDPCTPFNGQFNISAPLMHSTPTSYQPRVAPRRHGRFMDVAHRHPYFIQHYDGMENHLQHIPQTFQPHPCILPSSQLTPSSSSASSTGSSSIPSSASTSPESSAMTKNEKQERRTGGKSKRIRTIFTPEQLDRLEAEFERQQYMVGTERFFLASSLSLTEAQVKVWFQNRRIKWRKQHLEQQQARLAKGDLFRDLEEESEDSDLEEPKPTQPHARESSTPTDSSV